MSTAVVRYQALDKCFRNTGRKYGIDDLVEACNVALYDHYGSNEGVKKRQVYKDINFMQSDASYAAPIVKEKEGRKAYYKYADINYSINKQPLTEKEKQEIKEMLITFNRFVGLPEFEWMEEITTRLEANFQLGIQVNKVMEFEQNPYLKGSEYIKEIYHSIVNKSVLSLNYKSYKSDKEINIELHPYFLKQYNNRWFLFGKNPLYDNITNLALDRIVQLKQISKEYIPTEIDFQEYFEDIIGVTFSEGKEIVKVKLQIDGNLWPYIESKPLHGSQKLIEKKEDCTFISIEVIPNYELESLLLQFGEKIIVLEPKEFKDKLHQRIKRLDENYNNAD